MEPTTSGALISGGLGFAGSVASGLMGQSNAKEAWRATKKLYKRRYQYTMQDLEKAGLNPMLAMSHGPGATPSMQPAPTPDFSAAVGHSANFIRGKSQAKLAEAQVDASINSAREINARADSAEAQAFREQQLTDQWQKDPGLASATAMREAYNPSGNIPYALFKGPRSTILNTISNYSDKIQNWMDSQRLKTDTMKEEYRARKSGPQRGNVTSGLSGQRPVLRNRTY